MSTTFAIMSLVEFFICILLIIGFMNEEKVITFEQHVKRIVKGNFKRVQRLLKKKLIQLLHFLDNKQYKLYYKRFRKYSAKLIEYKFF